MASNLYSSTMKLTQSFLSAQFGTKQIDQKDTSSATQGTGSGAQSPPIGSGPQGRRTSPAPRRARRILADFFSFFFRPWRAGTQLSGGAGGGGGGRASETRLSAHLGVSEGVFVLPFSLTNKHNSRKGHVLSCGNWDNPRPQ